MRAIRFGWLLVRTLWTLPTTAVGLAVALPCWAMGSRLQVREGTLEVHSGPLAYLLEHATVLKGGASAITFGDLILGRSAAALDAVRGHEQVHVRQAHRWGPLFIPAYLMASAWVGIKGGRAYRDNPVEVEADGERGEG